VPRFFRLSSEPGKPYTGALLLRSARTP